MWGQQAEPFHLKARNWVSNFIPFALDMADFQVKIIPECQKSQVANQVHHPRNAGPLRIHYVYDWPVVAEK